MERINYLIRDENDAIVSDVVIDIDSARPFEVDDHVWGDNGIRYRILGFRHIDAETRDVLTEPDPEETAA